MALSYELISQFAKLAAENKKTNTESTVYGTVKVDEHGNKYVKLDGSDQLTPLTDENRPSMDTASATANDGERVSVLIKNHTATVTGNISPSGRSARTEDVEDLGKDVSEIKKFDILIGDKVQANEAYFKKLLADEVTLGKLTASEASIVELIANSAEIDELLAGKITVTDLIAKKIDADVVIADQAIIEKLQSSNIDVLSLIADKAVITDLIAENADLNSLEAKNAYLKYVNIDFSNINQAWMDEFYAKSGLVEFVTAEDATVTGHLVGVTITGDMIEAGTLVVDKLVVLGTDGNYYKLNTDFTGIPDVEPVEESAIHGSVMVANSITAEKISVSDLVAFGATIAGFHIKRADDEGLGSIYSGVKSSVDNSVCGLYMDDDGQFALGNDYNYLKFYRVVDESGNDILDEAGNPIYRLEISAESILFGASSKTSAADLKALTEHVKIGRVVGDKTDTEIDAVEGTMMDGVLTPTGEQVYEYVDSDGIKVYYCIVDSVYYRVNVQPSVELSEGDSDFKQVITNTKTMFKDGETTKTEISTDGVKTNNLDVKGELSQNGFMWVTRANGNYGLSWKGVTN